MPKFRPKFNVHKKLNQKKKVIDEEIFEVPKKRKKKQWYDKGVVGEFL